MAETSMGQMDLIGAPYIQHRVGDADPPNRRGTSSYRYRYDSGWRAVDLAGDVESSRSGDIGQ